MNTDFEILQVTKSFIEVNLLGKKTHIDKGYLRWALGEVLGWQQGRTNFTAKLMALIAKADNDNKKKIAKGFAEEVFAYFLWYHKEEYQVSSSVYLDEEQASELIEYLIEVTGDTYDRDNNTEYYQKMQSEKKAEDRYIANVEYKNNLIKSTIHAFAETMTKEQILQLFLSVTSNEQNKEIVQKMMN